MVGFLLTALGEQNSESVRFKIGGVIVVTSVIAGLLLTVGGLVISILGAIRRRHG